MNETQYAALIERLDMMALEIQSIRESQGKAEEMVTEAVKNINPVVDKLQHGGIMGLLTGL